MTMGCTPSSHSSDQTGFAYGCRRNSSANDLPPLTQDQIDSGSTNRRPSIEMNGTHTGVQNNKDMRDSLVCLLFVICFNSNKFSFNSNFNSYIIWVIVWIKIINLNHNILYNENIFIIFNAKPLHSLIPNETWLYSWVTFLLNSIYVLHLVLRFLTVFLYSSHITSSFLTVCTTISMLALF